MVTPRSDRSTGARDGYIAEVLQRLARARTNLVLAERAAVRPPALDQSPDTVELVESARVDLLWATASAIVAPDGFDKVTVNVSSGSTSVSPAMSTCTICDITPGWKVTVPEVAE